MFKFPKSAIDPRDKKILSEFPLVQDYYRVKHDLAVRADAMRILEVGVRKGYSAFAFLSARPDAHYLGIDNLSGTFGGTGDSYIWAERLLRRFPNATLLHADTQQMADYFSATKLDLVHIDGDHTTAGCLHDMNLFWRWVRPGGLMVVDDYDYQPAVRAAAHTFRGNPKNGYLGLVPYLEYIKDYRGEAVFRKPYSEGQMAHNLLAERTLPEGLFIEIGCGPRSTPQIARTASAFHRPLHSFDINATKVEAVKTSVSNQAQGSVQFHVGHSWEQLHGWIHGQGPVAFAFLDSGQPNPYAKPSGGAVLTFGEFKLLEPHFVPGSCLLIDNAMLPEHTSPCYSYRRFPKGRILVPYLLASGRWHVTGYPHDAGGMVFAECQAAFPGDFPAGSATWSVEKIDSFIRNRWAGENYDADSGYCRFGEGADN